MFLKLTAAINGDHQMIGVVEYKFSRHPRPVITYSRFEPTPAGPILVTHVVEPEATVYVLNDNGKTIETLSITQTDRKTGP